MTRVAYLGPAGTFSGDALDAAAAGAEIEPVATPTVYDAIRAVADGRAELAFVPFENSTEGSVRATLDTLAFDALEARIVGEHDEPIRHSLIARTALELTAIEVVLSHPQASSQCARFLRRELGNAEIRPASSTAEAVREVGSRGEPWAALGAAAAAELYGCVVLREGVEDEHGNLTRFVWVAAGEGRGAASQGGAEWRTTLWFSELGADHPGALVEVLREFSSREVNLVRIESRPLRTGMGRYMFFVDLEGGAHDPTVAEAIAAVREKAENVRVLGSYPVHSTGPPALAG